MEELFRKLADSLKSGEFTLKDSFSVEWDECSYKIFQLGDFEITVEYAAIVAYSELSLTVRYNGKDILEFYSWDKNEPLALDNEIDGKFVAVLNKAANEFARRVA